MKVIYKGRRCGKTTDLIKLAHECKGYMVCATPQECTRVFHEAREMGYDINFPISRDEFEKGQYHSLGVKELYIDNADYLFQEWLRHRIPVPVAAISINNFEEEPARDSK